MVNTSKNYKNSFYKSKQKGFALILFVFMLGLTITTLSIKLFSSGNLKTKRNINTVTTLEKAKVAIVGNALTGLSGSGLGQFPCDEDTTRIGSTTEGVAKGTCNGAPVVGRFAWGSLNTGDLRDSNSDKIWYALSGGYRTTPVNSDTIPALTVNGVPNKAIAVLLSPGNALPSQTRPIPTATSAPAVLDYLELENSNGDNIFTVSTSTSTFNDQSLLIEPDDVYPLLEKRVLKEFKNYLNAYKLTWGTFPFPSPFSNPNKAITSYIGNAGISGGFLPVSDNGITTTWDTTAVPVPTIVAPPGNIVVPVCTFRTSNTRIRCDVTIFLYNSISPPTISIPGKVNNIGMGFYDGLVVTNTNDLQITTRSGTATVASNSRAINHSVDSTGTGLVTFSGTLTNTGVVRIEFRRAPPHSNWVLAATNHYLLANNWHQLIYYRVASGFLPGGTQICGANCLTINRIDTTPNATQTNIHALLVSAGRKLNITNNRPAPTYGTSNPAQSRPGSTLADYYDSVNNVTAGLTFDKSEYSMNTFNDLVEMVE